MKQIGKLSIKQIGLRILLNLIIFSGIFIILFKLAGERLSFALAEEFILKKDEQQVFYYFIILFLVTTAFTFLSNWRYIKWFPVAILLTSLSFFVVIEQNPKEYCCSLQWRGMPLAYVQNDAKFSCGHVVNKDESRINIFKEANAQVRVDPFIGERFGGEYWCNSITWNGVNWQNFIADILLFFIGLWGIDLLSKKLKIKNYYILLSIFLVCIYYFIGLSIPHTKWF